MITIMPSFMIALLIGVMLLGLVLLATGIVLLLKLKNKLAGGLTSAAGAVLTIFPVLILLGLVITQRVQS